MVSQLTPLAVECRRLRKEHGKLMADQAEALQLSAAFISAVETGAKGVPAGYIHKFARWLGLSDEQLRKVEDACDASAKTVKLYPDSADKAKLVVELGRRLPTLTTAEIRSLHTVLRKEKANGASR